MTRSRLSLLALLAALAIVVAACGESTVKTAAEEPAAEAAAGDQAEAKAPATIGSTITLTGLSDEKMEVTLLAVRRTAQSGNEFITPSDGNRFAAVRIQLKNVGDVVYDDAPSNGATLIDTKDQNLPATPIDIATPSLGVSKIAPGAKRVGWISFEVPKAAKLKTFQFTLSSGMADDIGEWTLTK